LKQALKKTAGWTVPLALAVACVMPVSAATSHATKHPPAKKRAAAKSPVKSPVRNVGTRRRRRVRYTPFRYRLAHLQMSSDRVQEIQSALAKEGYYQSEPSGKWDEPTKAAMRNYQAANGFDPTGLPDAKSLMKLGLGPHPLPLELDPSAQSRVNPEAAPKTDPAARPTADDKTGQPNKLNQP
jgi:peptidoglycan hydrolase-like protein with peptidoglycan-binding domain